MPLIANVEALIQHNPPLAFLTVFLAGVGVSFTPCVYPVIPLTLGVIGARSAGSRAKGFVLSLVYVLGMAVVYACLGAFAALSGKIFGGLGSSPWSYFFVANVCLAMALSMFGIFELPQIRLVKAAPSGRRGLLGVFLAGAVSGLIVGPCTAPVLATILVYVGDRHNVPYGISLLFTFGYGVGFLMILLGTFTGFITSIPKSGPWLVRVKMAFGWLLVAAAEYFLVKMGGLLI